MRRIVHEYSEKAITPNRPKNVRYLVSSGAFEYPKHQTPAVRMAKNGTMNEPVPRLIIVKRSRNAKLPVTPRNTAA